TKLLYEEYNLHDIRNSKSRSPLVMKSHFMGAHTDTHTDRHTHTVTHTDRHIHTHTQSNSIRHDMQRSKNKTHYLFKSHSSRASGPRTQQQHHMGEETEKGGGGGGFSFGVDSEL